VKSDKKFSTTEDPLIIIAKVVLDFYFGSVKIDTIKSFAPKTDIFDEERFLYVMENFGLYAFDRKIKALDIPKHLLPAIILDESGTRYLLFRKDEQIAEIFDPLKQEKRKIPLKKLKSFKRAIFVMRDKLARELLEESGKDWFWEPIKSFWRSYVEVAILTLFINFFALAIPLYVMNVYNRIIPNNAFDTLFDSLEEFSDDFIRRI